MKREKERDGIGVGEGEIWLGSMDAQSQERCVTLDLEEQIVNVRKITSALHDYQRFYLPFALYNM